MARTRWPPGPVRPGLLPRPGRSDRQRRWVPKNLGPADRSFLRTTRMASADSEVRPEPRPLTIPPHQINAREAGPRAYPHPPCRLRAAERSPRLATTQAQILRYLKSFSSVYDVAGHAFELRRGQVILSGVHDAPEAVSHA